MAKETEEELPEASRKPGLRGALEHFQRGWYVQSEPRAAKKPLDLATQKSLESTEQIWWDKPTNAPPSTAKEVPTPGHGFHSPKRGSSPGFRTYEDDPRQASSFL